MYRVLLAVSVLAIGLVPSNLQKVKLQLKHLEESSTTVKTTSKIHQVLSVSGQDLETRSSSTVKLTSSVGRRDHDNRLPITQRIDALAVQLSLPMGGTLDFDSSNPGASSDSPRFQGLIDTYKARVGSSYTIILGKDNQVIAVEGIEKILENATPAAAELLRADIKPELAKRAAEQAFNNLSKEPVSKGDTWMRTSYTRVGGGQMMFQTKFEYLGTVRKDGQDLDQIGTTAQSVTYSIDEDTQAQLKITQSNLKIESSKGTILFDRVRGQPMESNSITRIVGDITLEVNGMEFPGKLDLTIDSASAVQK
jgi:hypothetical protein